MKNKRSKWSSTLAIVMVFALVLSACSNSEQNSSSESENNEVGKVTLKMILLGDKPADADLVYQELSKMAQKDINAKIEVTNFTWGEWAQKYSLLFSAGEDFDLIYASNWTDYQGFASKNGFLELTEDLLSKNAPITWEKTPKDAWEQAKVNGKVYAVPQAVQENGAIGFLLRGDLREKNNVPPVKDMAGLDTYLTAIAKNDQGITPFAYHHSTENFIRTLFDPNLEAPDNIGVPSNQALSWNVHSKEGMQAKVTFENEGYKNFANTMFRWQKEGILSKNALSQKEKSPELFEAGKSAVQVSSLDQISNTAVTIEKKHPDWKAEIFMPEMNVVPSGYMQNGVAINARSKNPELSLQFLDLLKWNKEYSDLTWYGIKGKHWEPVGDDRFKELADSSNYPPGANDPWGWRGPNERWSVESPDEIVKELRDYRKIEHKYPYGSNFIYSDANVKNENAAIQNLAEQYMNPASVGLIDYETAYARFESAAKKAGLDTTLKDLQAQLDAYKAENP
ncbi:ABC transporter substrate-binding protein [Paenibacillus sp. 276b]|uniref:ABC transporter substrate-binding protein n=1 Tax=Paenibacillus sp. 276b TaxID=1566277 RepID=UPI00089DA4CC|nr:ABC transporter substrate-binding protein [Paenibacillus sp. 276b]SEA61353.1 putative aldouronate transport system substrate-binding protein [Paenibacillus sp. 276b]